MAPAPMAFVGVDNRYACRYISIRDGQRSARYAKPKTRRGRNRAQQVVIGEQREAVVEPDLEPDTT